MTKTMPFEPGMFLDSGQAVAMFLVSAAADFEPEFTARSIDIAFQTKGFPEFCEQMGTTPEAMRKALQDSEHSRQAVFRKILDLYEYRIVVDTLENLSAGWDDEEVGDAEDDAQGEAPRNAA